MDPIFVVLVFFVGLWALGYFGGNWQMNRNLRHYEEVVDGTPEQVAALAAKGLKGRNPLARVDRYNQSAERTVKKSIGFGPLRGRQIVSVATVECTPEGKNRTRIVARNTIECPTYFGIPAGLSPLTATRRGIERTMKSVTLSRSEEHPRSMEDHPIAEPVLRPAPAPVDEQHRVVLELASGPLVFNTGPALKVTKGSASRAPADSPSDRQAPTLLQDTGRGASGRTGGSNRSRYLVVGALAGVAAVVLFLLVQGGGDEEGRRAGEPSVAVETAQQASQDDAMEVDAPSDNLILQQAGDVGVWVGEAYFSDAPPRQRDYDLALRLESDGTGSLDGQLRFRNAKTGVSGAWAVYGQSADGELTLTPSDWISKPNPDWSREGLQVSILSTGDLSGGAVNEFESFSDGQINLELISQDPVDSDSVGADWRVALVSPEKDALEMLEGMRDNDLSTRDTLDGTWVPQVSSGCQGLKTELGSVTAASILATHARAMQEFGAITVTWDDVGTTAPEACPNDTMWVALVPETFQKAAGAKRWCTSNGYSGGSCAARYLVPRGSRGTDIEYLD